MLNVNIRITQLLNRKFLISTILMQTCSTYMTINILSFVHNAYTTSCIQDLFNRNNIFLLWKCWKLIFFSIILQQIKQLLFNLDYWLVLLFKSSLTNTIPCIIVPFSSFFISHNKDVSKYNNTIYRKKR